MVMIVSPFFYLFIFSSCRLSWHAILQYVSSSLAFFLYTSLHSPALLYRVLRYNTDQAGSFSDRPKWLLWPRNEEGENMIG